LLLRVYILIIIHLYEMKEFPRASDIIDK